MTELSTRQQASRAGHARRIKDPHAQQRILAELGVEVSLATLTHLAPGQWLSLAAAHVRR